MGLSTVGEIVKYHEGTITVDSTVGKGSTFTVTFPIRIWLCMCGGALLVLLAWNITAQAVSAASMHLNRPQVACKVVLVNEVFSLGPGETKTIVEDLDVNHYDRIV